MVVSQVRPALGLARLARPLGNGHQASQERFRQPRCHGQLHAGLPARREARARPAHGLHRAVSQSVSRDDDDARIATCTATQRPADACNLSLSPSIHSSPPSCSLVMKSPCSQPTSDCRCPPPPPPPAPQPPPPPGAAEGTRGTRPRTTTTRCGGWWGRPRCGGRCVLAGGRSD
eukprot:COSAG01_NODE_10282_length_2201_cov_6.031399_4_plen_174_part_00